MFNMPSFGIPWERIVLYAIFTVLVCSAAAMLYILAVWLARGDEDSFYKCALRDFNYVINAAAAMKPAGTLLGVALCIHTTGVLALVITGYIGGWLRIFVILSPLPLVYGSREAAHEVGTLLGRAVGQFLLLFAGLSLRAAIVIGSYAFVCATEVISFSLDVYSAIGVLGAQTLALVLLWAYKIVDQDAIEANHPTRRGHD